jgi:hypothetical protein
VVLRELNKIPKPSIRYLNVSNNRKLNDDRLLVIECFFGWRL